MGSDKKSNISDIVNDYFYTSDNPDIYDRVISEIEKAVIIKALERSEGNRILASRILGIHRNTLNNRIKKLNIDVETFKK